MNTYEALIVFKPMLDVDNADGVLKNVENAIQNLKGNILKVDKIGRRRLAYEIGKFKDGYMTVFFMQLEPSAIVELKKICQLNEDILRLTLIRQEHYALASATNMNSAPTREFSRGDRGSFDSGRRERTFRTPEA